MRPGHRQNPLVVQDVFIQPLRPGHVGQARIEDGLDQRITARNHVAHDEHVGALRYARKLFRTPAFGEADPERRQLSGHRRIDVGIATGDGVARALRNGGDAAHERAADAQDVQVH